jgi:Xaa-Pro aminopeptidase
MCVSDEPGFYKDGEFGIRIENVIMVQTHPERPDFYHFENMTCAPYCREMLKPEIMPKDTIEYVNKHHQNCLEKLAPQMADDPRALAYVQRQCEPIPV